MFVDNKDNNNSIASEYDVFGDVGKTFFWRWISVIWLEVFTRTGSEMEKNRLWGIEQIFD